MKLTTKTKMVHQYQKSHENSDSKIDIALLKYARVKAKKTLSKGTEKYDF